MLKLLLVEDDKVIAGIYHRKFAQDGFEVRLCENGRDAIACFDDFLPDVVVLDLNLPILNGFEVLRHIRALTASENLPVVVFSNAYQPKLIEEAWQSGASAVLMKANTNPRMMVETIRELLNALPPKPEADESQPIDTVARQRLEGLPEFIIGFRRIHGEFMTAPDETTRKAALLGLSRAANGLAGSAAAVGMSTLARVAEAFQALLQELHDRPAAIAESTLRTSELTMAAISRLATTGEVPILNTPPVSVLLADGNDLSTRLAHFAFQKAGITATTVDHAESVLKACRSAHFDLVVLDSDVSGMTTLDCARQLRTALSSPPPIVIVFPAHELSRHVGAVAAIGAHLIAKPYPAAELAALALGLIHQHRLPPGKA